MRSWTLTHTFHYLLLVMYHPWRPAGTRFLQPELECQIWTEKMCHRLFLLLDVNLSTGGNEKRPGAAASPFVLDGEQRRRLPLQGMDLKIRQYIKRRTEQSCWELDLARHPPPPCSRFLLETLFFFYFSSTQGPLSYLSS